MDKSIVLRLRSSKLSELLMDMFSIFYVLLVVVVWCVFVIDVKASDCLTLF